MFLNFNLTLNFEQEEEIPFILVSACEIKLKTVINTS